MRRGLRDLVENWISVQSKRMSKTSKGIFISARLIADWPNAVAPTNRKPMYLGINKKRKRTLPYGKCSGEKCDQGLVKGF